MPDPLLVFEAICAWKPGDPIVELFASLSARSVLRQNEIAVARDANAQAITAGTDRALQVLAPSARNPPLANAAALTADSQLRLEQLELAHARSLRQNVRSADFVARRAAAAHDLLPPLPDLRSRFCSRAKCVKYLRRWQRSRGISCARCGARSIDDIVARGKFACESCRHQWSVRAGTILEGSKIPLQTWFGAIQAVLAAPTVSSLQLARHLDCQRVETARQLKNRISLALSSPDRSILLAGLDEIFSGSAALGAPHLPRETNHNSLPNSEPNAKPR